MKRSGDLAMVRSGDRKGRRYTASYQGTGFSRAVESKNTWASAPVVFRKVMNTVRAVLCEIFDE
ncbi:MAG: hypothetical protein ACXVK3_06305, partial [Candidatus Angelobacter sp.]